jgi:hypothetical protein
MHGATIKNTFYVQYRFSENRAVYEIVWENMIDPNSPHMTIYGICALHAG